MKNILVVDDDADTRTLLKKSLEKLSYKIDLAANGLEAMEKVKLIPYDLILLDAVMPMMDGFTVLKKLRTGGGINTSSQVMMISAKKDRKSVFHALKLGACDFIVKPFDTGTLLHKVCRWANKSSEDGWKYLGQEGERALRLTIATLDKAHEAVLSGGKLPYEDISNASGQIVNVIKKGGIKKVLDALQEHDSYTFVHSMRVGIFLSVFSKSIDGFIDEDVKTITEGGIIHDVGKAKTPLRILNKPGSFVPEEWEEMKNHVNHGVEALQKTPEVPAAVLEIAWCHHEKLDGSGYPRGLKADEIGTLARMAAIVDIYVALTDRRVYKPGFPHEKSMKIIREKPDHFDMTLVDDFEEVIKTGRLDQSSTI